MKGKKPQKYVRLKKTGEQKWQKKVEDTIIGSNENGE